MILNKLCTLVIDGGSCTNAVRLEFVKGLGIPTHTHPKPYRLHWLSNSGDLKVSKQAHIPLSIGRYRDVVLCDVVPMEAAHVLLGRPWQFDRYSQHDGRTNKYQLIHGDTTYKLKPLSPTEILKDQLERKVSREKKERELKKREMREEKSEPSKEKGSKT